jgi:hypothetical protein
MRAKTRQRRWGFTLSRRGRTILLAIAGVAVLVAALAVYDFLRINLWIDSDAGQFEHYPVVLIQQQRATNALTQSAPASIDRVMAEYMRRGPQPRNILTLARSELKHNLLRTRVYAKVLLETAAPDNPEVRSRLVVLCTFKRSADGWKLVGAVEKTLE